MKQQNFDDFLEHASRNEQDATKYYADFVQFIRRIDELFRGLREEPMPGFPAVALLYLNSHACFLAACRIALSGQTPPAFTALRGAVESAMYALIASQSKEYADIWVDRAKDADGLKACRQVYKAQTAIDILQKDPNLATLTRQAYDLSIEFGAHPNVRAILYNVHMHENQISFVYLNEIPSLPVVRTIGACVEKGLISVQICIHALSEIKAAKDIWDAAITVRKEYDHYVFENGYLEKEPPDIPSVNTA